MKKNVQLKNRCTPADHDMRANNVLQQQIPSILKFKRYKKFVTKGMPRIETQHNEGMVDCMYHHRPGSLAGGHRVDGRCTE
jgi:hypothetical protein